MLAVRPVDIAVWVHGRYGTWRHSRGRGCLIEYRSEAHRLVGRDGAGRYRLGLRLLGWAGAVSAEVGLVEAARPVLEALRDETGESAQLFVRDGDHRLCVAASERPAGLRDTVPIGAVLPIDRGSGGKVLLAWSPDAGR